MELFQIYSTLNLQSYTEYKKFVNIRSHPRILK